MTRSETAASQIVEKYEKKAREALIQKKLNYILKKMNEDDKKYIREVADKHPEAIADNYDVYYIPWKGINGCCLHCKDSSSCACCWADRGEEVDGWIAKPSVIRQAGEEANNSFKIYYCPNFKPEDREEKGKKPKYNYESCVNMLMKLASEYSDEYRTTLKKITGYRESLEKIDLHELSEKVELVLKYNDALEDKSDLENVLWKWYAKIQELENFDEFQELDTKVADFARRYGEWKARSAAAGDGEDDRESPREAS